MTLIAECPSCGLESDEIRCPRCNTLKIQGCSGVCSGCLKASCKVATTSAPSVTACVDAEHPGTPLER